MATNKKQPITNILHLIIIFTAIISSCNSQKGAFSRVVDYYSSNNEELKAKAAEYLYDYADVHYGIPRHLSRIPEYSYKDFINRTEGRKDSLFFAYLDSCDIYMATSDTIWDIDTISEEFLRENIDLAFDSWNKPWSSNVSFSDFCKYILPYRNGDEEISHWRKFFKERYESSIADSVANPKSMPDVINYLMRRIRQDIEYGGSMGLLNNSLLTHEEMLKLHWMECMGCAHYTTLAMRACGIPCAMIETHWRFTEIAHYSVLFPEAGDNKKAFRLTVGDTLMYMGEPKDSMAAWRVWEYDYETNPERLLLQREQKGRLTTFEYLYNPPTLSDVTPSMCMTFDFAMPVPDSLQHNNYIYLCRFNDWHWYPIREGYVKKDSVYFKNATIRQWYRLGYQDGDSIKTYGTPFTISGDKSISNFKERILPYNLSGDTILFRLAYRDCVEANLLYREIATNYWDSNNQWRKYTGTATLWGHNPKTGEYRIYKEVMHNPDFRPDFHLLDVRLPRMTVFFDNELSTPQGFITADPENKEGYLMQF